jgi:hypothetical protein
MPRGGSKKGERRGGRRAGVPNRRTEEKRREIAIVLGKADLTVLPREVMLQAMRHFFEMSLTAHAEVNRLIGEGDLPAAATAELKFERYMILAGDMAYKAAPYLHARLQAVMLSTPQDRPPASAIAELLKEINATMREPRGMLINGTTNPARVNGNGHDTEH